MYRALQSLQSFIYLLPSVLYLFTVIQELTELYTSLNQKLRSFYFYTSPRVLADKSKKLLLFCCILSEMAYRNLQTDPFLNMLINTL